MKAYKLENYGNDHELSVIKYNDDGKPIIRYKQKENTVLQKWNDKGVLVYNVEDYETPSKTCYGKEYENTIMHYSDNGQPQIRYAEDGKTVLQKWNDKGKLIYQLENYRIDSQSSFYYDNYYYNTIMMYSDDGKPAVRYAEDGETVLQKWDKDGKLIYEKPEEFERRDTSYDYGETKTYKGRTFTMKSKYSTDNFKEYKKWEDEIDKQIAREKNLRDYEDAYYEYASSFFRTLFTKEPQPEEFGLNYKDRIKPTYEYESEGFCNGLASLAYHTSPIGFTEYVANSGSKSE